MFPHTQKHTLGRVINLDVAQKCSIFIGSVVTSTPPSQCALSAGTCPPAGWPRPDTPRRPAWQGRASASADCRRCKPPALAPARTATAKTPRRCRSAAGPERRRPPLHAPAPSGS